MIRGWAAGLPEMILGSSGGTWYASCPLRPHARRRRGRHTPATRLVARRGCPRCPRARRPCICPLSTSPARPGFANRTIAPLRASCPAPAQLPSASPGASLSLFPARPPAQPSVLSRAARCHTRARGSRGSLRGQSGIQACAEQREAPDAVPTRRWRSGEAQQNTAVTAPDAAPCPANLATFVPARASARDVQSPT